MTIKKKSGQILVLVLLVVVVILAVGLSVASRNLTNLRTSTQAEQSQRAFTAAEGGVEDALSKINAVANVIETGTAGNNCVRESADTASCGVVSTDPSVTSGNVKVRAIKGYEKTVEPGDVAQVNLQTAGTTSWTGNLQIDWVKPAAGDPQEVTLEFIFVCEGTSGDCMGQPMSNGYGQHRYVFRGPVQPSGQVGTFDSCVDPGGDFDCRARVGGNNYFVISSNVKIIRIKPFWNKTTLQVTPITNSTTFPVQTYEITSTATTETGVTRKVEVRRDSLPQLPSIFDFVLYSGGDIVK